MPVERRVRPRFSLVYGSEAMLPTKVTLLSVRVQNYDEDTYDDQCQMELIAAEELWDRSLIRAAKYHQGLRRYQDRSVRNRQFQAGELVLRKIQTTKDRHKLSPVWEGPFVVKFTTRPGAYRLMIEEGAEVPNSRNIDQLRRFYS